MTIKILHQITGEMKVQKSLSVSNVTSFYLRLSLISVNEAASLNNLRDHLIDDAGGVHL